MNDGAPKVIRTLLCVCVFSQDAFLSKELHLFQQAVIIELRSMPHSCVDIVKSMMAGIDVLQNESVSHTHTHTHKKQHMSHVQNSSNGL